MNEAFLHLVYLDDKRTSFSLYPYRQRKNIIFIYKKKRQNNTPKNS